VDVQFLSLLGPGGAVGETLRLISARRDEQANTYRFELVFEKTSRAFIFRPSDRDFLDELISVAEWKWVSGENGITSGIPGRYQVYRLKAGTFVAVGSFSSWPPPRKPDAEATK